jgi:hypothetical protein
MTLEEYLVQVLQGELIPLPPLVYKSTPLEAFEYMTQFNPRCNHIGIAGHPCTRPVGHYGPHISRTKTDLVLAKW